MCSASCIVIHPCMVHTQYTSTHAHRQGEGEGDGEGKREKEKRLNVVLTSGSHFVFFESKVR